VLWISAEKVYDTGEFMGLRFVNLSYQRFAKLRRWIMANSAANTDESGEIKLAWV
jgi:hypothetical protein